jgi:hypothetical protein
MGDIIGQISGELKKYLERDPSYGNTYGSSVY